MEATKIHLDYLNREEDATIFRPALKVEDKCYCVHLHNEKLIGYNDGLKNWKQESEDLLLKFIQDNNLDTKVCLSMKRYMVCGLTLEQAYEKYLDDHRKPHPRYHITVNNLSEKEAKLYWEKLIANQQKHKKKKQSYFDDPNPEQLYDLWVDYH